jgi:hypothetical protein
LATRAFCFRCWNVATHAPGAVPKTKQNQCRSRNSPGFLPSPGAPAGPRTALRSTNTPRLGPPDSTLITPVLNHGIFP